MKGKWGRVMTELSYFAYGSNLHPLRLHARLPAARFKQIGYISGYRLNYGMRGRDASAKCNLIYTGSDADFCYGAVYSLQVNEKLILDEHERHYDTHTVEVLIDRRLQSCFTYIAQAEHQTDSLLPFSWYRDIVCHGGRFLGFPESYIEHLENTDVQIDPDEERRLLHERLIEDIRTD